MSLPFDRHAEMSTEVAFDLQEITSDTATVGEIIDIQGFRSLEFIFQSGTLTDGAYVVSLEHGDDSGLSDTAAVPADNILGDLPSFALADDDVTKRVGTNSKKRYFRATVTSSATTSGGFMSGVAVLGHAASIPTAD